MARKSWSYVFFSAGGANVFLAFVPANPLKLVNWILMPCCLACGLLVRRTMISKPRHTWHVNE